VPRRIMQEIPWSSRTGSDIRATDVARGKVAGKERFKIRSCGVELGSQRRSVISVFRLPHHAKMPRQNVLRYDCRPLIWRAAQLLAIL
jgi:hypothetical protein